MDPRLKRPLLVAIPLVALLAGYLLGTTLQRAAPPPGAAFFIRNLSTPRDRREARAELLDAPILPGSVMKPVTLVTALESGLITPATAAICRRVVTVDGVRFTCAHPDLKRPLSAAEALAHSCNSFFVSLAPRLSREAVNRTRLAAGAAFLGITSIAIAIGISRDQAVRARDRAEAAKLLALAELKLQEDSSEALAFTMASLEVEDSEEARVFAMKVLWEAPPAFELDVGSQGSRVPEFSPDGKWLASAGHAASSRGSAVPHCRRRRLRLTVMAWVRFADFTSSTLLARGMRTGAAAAIASRGIRLRPDASEIRLSSPRPNSMPTRVSPREREIFPQL